MKKSFLTFVLLAICGLTFAQLQTAPQWNRVLSDSPETFRTQLISSTENSIKVNVQVPGFYTVNVTTPRGEAKVITMPKTVSTAKAGEPEMPMTGIPAIIGDQARMNIRVLDAQYMDFEGIEVAPSKGDFPRTIDPATVPYTYGECYSQDAFFPSRNVGLYEPYIIRDFRGQNMVVYPYAYNPITKTLRVYYNMTVEMYKVDNNGVNTMQTNRSGVIKMDPDFKSMYQRHFINYEAAMNRYTPITEEGDLLIICYDNFISNMTDFVNWKKTRGINTTIVGTTTAGSTYSAIKSYIQNQYNANNNITHVLLVGDVAQIPGYSYSGGGSSYSGLGDNAYGQIVGSDIYNDVFIGRFSASSAARVNTQVQRVITYERDLNTSATWLKVGEGISRKEGGSGHNSEDDYQHMDNIRTDLLNYGYTPVYQRYANLTGYDGSSSTISSDINSGVGIINYTNHGQETAWGANSSGYIYYSVSHVNALTNENKLPFIWSVACLVGKYDHSSDCFAEAWMNATNNNNPTGAIGTLMSYISQPWIPPMWAQDECVDILVESYSNNIKHTWGGMSINGLMGIFDHYGTSDQSAVGTYQAWILYGDPSLMLRTKTPQSMTVTHTGTLPLGNTTYSVTVSNGNGAVATITDANHNILGKATVSNGSATINISGSLTANQELTLCVFGYNKVTYLGTITVTGGTKYNIYASANPTAGGTVSGAGEYYENTSCTLTATANSHYEFSNWTKNGTQVSTANPYTFTVTGNATYVANFTALSPHTVTCTTVQNGTISASPTSAYKGETVTLTATPASGYCLGSWTVKDASNNNITVTNNQFTMPDSNVTVSATFVVGYNVTLAPATNGTISANPTSGPAGSTITLTATPATGYNFDSWVVYKTGDATTTVTVSNNTFTMPAYDVTVVGVFLAPQGGDVTIGSGTNANSYLPTYTYYNYSLTQQIYTSAEMGDAGTITAVAFKVSNSKPATRTIDIYLSHTSNGSFSGTSAWVSQSTSNRVFSGSVDFASSGWTTITLDTPFEYNGTSNLLITVDDNTGSYITGSSNNPSFYTYSTNSTNRAIYKYNDYTDYNPASMTTSGTLMAYNNQIVFTKEVPSTDGYLSVSPTSLSGFNTEAGTPSTPQSVAVIGSNLQSNLTVTAPSGYEVSSAQSGTYNSTLTLTPSNGNIRANVYVRLNVGSPNTYIGNLTFASGSTTSSVSLSGTVSQGSGTQYTITVNANPTAGGTVSGGGTYYENGTCTIAATANSGYTFTQWQDGNTANPRTITVTGNATYTAIFTLNSYEVTASANPTVGGTITGAGTYNHGTTATLTASASEGYTFTNWTKNGTSVSTNATYSFVVTQATSLVANFTINNYNVTATANPTEGGSVTVGVRNRDDLVYDFEDGWQGWTTFQGNTTSPNSWMHNTSYPTSNNNFSTGYGYNSSDGFMLSESYISGTSSGSGTAVTPDNYLVSPQVRLGGSVSFYAGARNTSYCAEKFSVMVSTTDNTNPASFTTVGTWTLSLSQAGYNSTPYTVDLSAFSGMGYIAIRHFDCYDQWFLAVDNVTIVEGVNQSTGSGNFNYGETCVVTATPNTDYHFVNWTENGTAVSSEATYSFTVTGDRDLVANFSQTLPTYYTINVMANPSDGGIVTGADSYVEGSTATLTATANEGYTFTNWTKNGSVVSTNANYSFTVTEAATYVANFTLNTYTITALVNPENAGTVTGAGTYSHGAGVILTATANDGYAFVNWTENGEVVCVNATCTSTATANRTLTANFEAVSTTTEQTVTINEGWGWWSTYVDITLNDLETALGTNGLSITSQNNGFVGNYSGTWLGELQSAGINHGQMYKIQTIANTSFTVSGTILDPTEVNITLDPSVNWIAFPLTQDMSLNEAFVNADPVDGDMVGSYESGFAQYFGNGWFGSLETLEPGQGYTYTSNASGTKTFTYPAATRCATKPNASTVNNNWVPVSGKHPDVMNFVVKANLNGIELSSETAEVAAFVNGECRGSAKLMYMEPVDAYLAFLTVYGVENETFNFKLYNEGEEFDANEQAVMHTNGYVGQLTDPFILNSNTTDEIVLFPNPVGRGEKVSLEVASKLNMNNAKVEIYNAMGALVRAEQLNQVVVEMPGFETAGVYTVKMSDGTAVYYGKLVVR